MVRDASGPMFYAGAIQGLNTLGALCWRLMPSGEIVKRWIVLISRIAEKTAHFTVTLLSKLIDIAKATGMFEGINRILWSSDCGTHFRSYQVLGTVSNNLLSSLRSEGVWTMDMWWGPEAHFKNKVY